MKTQILQLEPHDDPVSACDKMGWSQTGRVLLVWPEGSCVLNRRLDLILVRRHSTRLGAQIAVVTHDADVRYHARQLGIPLFRSIRQAQSSAWRVPRFYRSGSRPEELRPPGPRPDLAAIKLKASPPASGWMDAILLRIFFFTLGVMAMLSIVALLLPGAEVQVNPKTSLQEIDLPVQAVIGLDGINLAGSIPAQWSSQIVEGRDTLTVSGKGSIPSWYARGQVQFTNLTDLPASVPAGSVVLSSDPLPIRYEVVRSGEVPAGVGQTISLPVQAVEPGEAGNQPAGGIQAMEGPLGVNLVVGNLEPISGGMDQEIPIATNADRDALYERLEGTLRTSAIEEFTASHSPDIILLSAKPVLEGVLEKIYNPPEGEPGEQLELYMRLEYRFLTASRADLNALAQSVMDAHLRDGFTALPETIEISTVDQPVAREDGQASWRIHIRRSMQPNISDRQVIQICLGQDPRLASQRMLNDLSLAQPPTIIMSPSWWPRLPILPFRIEVISN